MVVLLVLCAGLLIVVGLFSFCVEGSLTVFLVVVVVVVVVDFVVKGFWLADVVVVVLAVVVGATLVSEDVLD